jgi:dihydroneopterin aldolase
VTIHIESLQIDTIIGLLDFERRTRQRVYVDLEATYLYKKDHFIDYADLCSLIERELTISKYELLEDALIGIKDKISILYPNIEVLRLKITKPDIIKNATVALSHKWEL